jgi:hypothetical protein
MANSEAPTPQPIKFIFIAPIINPAYIRRWLSRVWLLLFLASGPLEPPGELAPMVCAWPDVDNGALGLSLCASAITRFAFFDLVAAISNFRRL